MSRAAGGRLGRPFWLLFGGESASALGTAASVVALPVVALHAGGDVRQAGLAGTALSVGVLLARLPAGVIADRCERRTLLLVCDLVGAGVLAALALLASGGPAPLWALLAAALLLGVVGSTLAPAENVAVRSFVRPELLPRALGLLQTRAAVALIAGPLVAGALLAVDPAWVFAADAGSYLAAACCAALLPREVRDEVEGGPAERSGRAALAEGLRFIWRMPFLRYAAVNAAVLNLVFNGLLIVVVASAGDTVDVGVLTAALGAGGLAGSLFAPAVARRLPPARGIALGTVVVALALPGFTALQGHWSAAVPLAVAAAAGPVVTVLIAVTQMAVTPPRLQGRVHSGIGFLAQVIAPVGPTLAGLSAHALGLTATVAAAAAIVVVLAVAGVAATAGRAGGRRPGLAGAEPLPELRSDDPVEARRG
ncbi:MFS transporter [Kitasatospora sp. NBC_01300]|uniref:MFS transporter n=1 Tax=Kitasatospora sp. NBC_01300 TaxID=2903574 RepID=UPI00352C5A71|nr:MFS transporter [Kitasatospora sp. NBC_01300]